MPVKMDTQVEAAGRDTQREAISSDSSRTGEGQGKVVYVSIRFIFFTFAWFAAFGFWS